MSLNPVIDILARACVDFDGFAPEFAAYITVYGPEALEREQPVDTLVAYCAFAQARPHVLANLIRAYPTQVARFPIVREVRGVDAQLAAALRETLYTQSACALSAGYDHFPREAFFLVGAAMCVALGAAGTQQWVREYVDGRKQSEAN